MTTLLDLVERPIWVAWQTEPGDGGRHVKVPYAPGNGTRARSNEPNSWGTREAAAARAAHLPKPYEQGGVGLVLEAIAEGLHLGGVDLDACRDPSSGALAPWAREIVERFDSYVEVSPSNIGVKIFFVYATTDLIELRARTHVQDACTARRKGIGPKDPGIELYLAGRYFTVTDRQTSGTSDLRVVPLVDLWWLVEVAIPAFRGKVRAPKAEAPLSIEDIASAFNVILNDDLPWDEWNSIGMKIYAATDGSEEGYRIFDAWSRKASVYNEEATRARWDHYHRSPPDRVGPGSIIYLAQQAQPGWLSPSRAGKLTQAARLLKIAGQAELFHTPDNVGYADVEINNHRETCPIHGAAFGDWLVGQFYKQVGQPPNYQAMKGARGVIDSKARFDSVERQVYLRVARDGGKIYLDLGDASWRAAAIDSDGWRIIDRPSMRFRRSDGMLPLPPPEPGGDLRRDLRPFFNVATDDDFVLLVGWLLAAIGGRGPYPIVAATGEHGATKTSCIRVLRKVIDPAVLPTRSLSRSEEDLHIAAHNAFVLAFENVSKIEPWLSDALCRVATGGGFATRKLYENTNEVIFLGRRPIALDGIENFIERPDLADRTITLELTAIADDKRRTEGKLDAAFDAAHAKVLGALLDAAAHGLRRLPDISLKELPRMADAVEWITACEGALWDEGTFARAYKENREGGQVELLEGDPVAGALRTLMDNDEEVRDGAWDGTAKALLVALYNYTSDETRRDWRWPKTERALGGRLRRAKPGLKMIGISVDFSRGHESRVHLRRAQTKGQGRQPGLVEPPGERPNWEC